MRQGTKRITTVAASVAATIGLLLNGATPAFAATRTVESDRNDLGVINGRHYVNFARLSVSDNNIRATVDIHTSPGEYAPAYDLQARVIAYKNGDKCSETDYDTNPFDTTDFQVVLDPACGPGKYTVMGRTQVWTGSSWKVNNTFVTPSLTYS